MQASRTLSPLVQPIRSEFERLAAEMSVLFDGTCKLTLARTSSQVPSFSVHSALEKKEAKVSVRAA